ncbi:MAG: signal peptidase I [Candidatus Thermoplasmatota archaeon]|nr:signal peptidase I [Candidatus Thermoplasmatota archaeon]
MPTLTQKTLISHLLFTAILLLICTRFLCIATNTPFPIDVVTSDSMTPTLIEGDIIFWTPIPLTDVQPGDIIIYKSHVHWPDSILITHRVNEVIKNTHGTQLITQGDANTWPDQSGPHLPEPYITKDNYIGTMLTLGPIPLKIPLLGQLGILLTQAMDVLSQTARNQDLITYLGVFAPLTIALILLFLSLLLLPDKVKTLPEKIKHLIFPEKQIPLKKMILGFFLCFFLLSTCTHLFAYDTFTANLGVNTYPDQNHFSFGQLQPNQTSFPKHIPLINPGIMPIKGCIFGSDDLHPYVNIQTFTIPPATYQQINLTVTTQPTTPPGIYQGAIMIYSSAFWLFIPNSLIGTIATNYPTISLYLLDAISSLIFTVITIILMILITSLLIHKHAHEIQTTLTQPKLPYLYRITVGIQKKLSHIPHAIQKIQWITHISLSHPPYPLITIVGLITLCSCLIFRFQFHTLLITPILSTIALYLTKHSTRQTIIQGTTLTLLFTTILLCGNTIIPLLPIESLNTLLSTTTYLTGITGIYLLFVGCLLLPLSLITWRLIAILQNVKEQTNPLHCLEGHSDL